MRQGNKNNIEIRYAKETYAMRETQKKTKLISSLHGQILNVEANCVKMNEAQVVCVRFVWRCVRWCSMCVHDICSVSTKLSARTSSAFFATSEECLRKIEKEICQQNVIEGKCALVSWMTLLRFMNLPMNFLVSVWSFSRNSEEERCRTKSSPRGRTEGEMEKASFIFYFYSFNWNKLFSRLQSF